MPRPPDSRATAGQTLEDEADAIADSIRRQAVDWSRRMMRGHPNNPRMQGAFVAGMIAASMDLMTEATGDLERAAQALQQNVDAYLDAMAEDRAADAQPKEPDHAD